MSFSRMLTVSLAAALSAKAFHEADFAPVPDRAADLARILAHRIDDAGESGYVEIRGVVGSLEGKRKPADPQTGTVHNPPQYIPTRAIVEIDGERRSFSVVGVVDPHVAAEALGCKVEDRKRPASPTSPNTAPPPPVYSLVIRAKKSVKISGDPEALNALGLHLYAGESTRITGEEALAAVQLASLDLAVEDGITAGSADDPYIRLELAMRRARRVLAAAPEDPAGLVPELPPTA